MNATADKLVPIGYLIVEDGAGIVISDTLGLRYFGVDRLPALIAPEIEVRQAMGKPPVADENERAALEAWFEIKDAPTPFISDSSRAADVVERIAILIPRLEVLFCEVVATSTGGVGGSYPPFEGEGQPQGLIAYGYDVSWPSCNHSAIRQPGIVPQDIRWQRRLNAWGLFSNIDDAIALRAEYLRVYPYPPFDIILVHKCTDFNL